MLKPTIVASAALFATFLLPAGAPLTAAVTLNRSAADFNSALPFFPIYRDDDGLPGNDFVRFGAAPAGFGSTGQSGQARFTSAAQQAIRPGISFTFGRLDFLNVPLIAGTGLQQITLSITPMLDGSPFAFGPLDLLLAIDETPNSGLPADCPFPSASPCADRIRILGTPFTSAIFGDSLATFHIDGFFDAQGNPQTSFIVEENSFAVASIAGRFTLDQAGAVPEPTTWAMLILGFGLLGAALRRQSLPSTAPA